jgi:GMP synthase-like glutamine amidotransferase
MAILIFEHSDLGGVGRLGAALNEYGHKQRILQLHRGDSVPDDLDDVDGIVSCGGPQHAHDDSIPWLEPQMQRMREAHAAGIPIIGLCLGAQILARALGGKVERMAGADSIEFGFTEVKLNPIGREDILHAGLAWNSMMFQHHRDHVSQLPPGARLLASSAKCKTQTWALGLRTYGFQYHPEITPDTVEVWMDDEPGALRQAGLSVEQVREQVQRHYPAFERLTDRLFDSIALYLMPVDRRYSGLVKDLHH